MSNPKVYPFNGVYPTIADDVWIAPGAMVVGDVTIGPGSSIWFNAVVRGDVAPVRIGAGSNVQDNAVLHVDTGRACVIGDNVTIGHSAIVHASEVGAGVVIGMGSIVLSRCTIGEGSTVAAGAVVAEDSVVEPRTVVMGVPAKPKRHLSDEEVERNLENAARYVRNAQINREGGIG